MNMAADPDAPGFSDIGIRNLLYTLTLSLKPSAVLEIGTHIGHGAVVIGEALRLNGFGRLYTLEPQKHYQQKATHYIQSARLDEYIEIVDGFSYTREVRQFLESKGPFELVFVDGSHNYRDVIEELRWLWSIVAENGVVLLHDSSISAQEFDSEHEGGVRRALLQLQQELANFKLLLLEYPLWLNPVGAAIASKQ